MMKTTKEFTMPDHRDADGALRSFRVEHKHADWREDVQNRMAILQVSTKSDGWVDYLTIRTVQEITQIETAIFNTPITTTTPVDAKIEKILAKYFPSIETFEPRNMDSLDFHEVFVADLKRAVAEAFAAGRDFEALKISKKAAKGGR